MARRRKAAGRKSANKFSGFIKAVGVSTAVSFITTSWFINPQLFETFKVKSFTNNYISSLLVDALPKKSVSSFVSVATQAPSVNGYVQTSFSQCANFFPNKKPPIIPADNQLRELCFTSFAILHNGSKKTPVFVAQRLNRNTLVKAKNVKRVDRFYAEARLPQAERAKLKDNRNSGYDRGHMAPAGDMFSEQAMAQSFSLSNIVPQDAIHNRGAWSKIENDTRKYVMRAQGDVYIFTGPFYGYKPIITVGNGQVAVPTHIYKVVFDATTNKSWVHWHANDANTQVVPPISYNKFVQQTGLYLLPILHN